MKDPFIKQAHKPSTILSNKMKDAIGNISFSNNGYNINTIGPITGQMMLDKNKTDGYQDTIFNSMLDAKIEQDFKTIKDGIDLLNFYLNKNKDIDEFNFDICILYNSIGK